MKKVAKSLVLLLIMSLILVALTGCGGDKLVATKTTEDDSMFGTYEEEIEISFKGDKADKIKMTLKFEKEDTAKSAYAIFNLGASILEDEAEDYDVKQSGKKLIIEMSATAYENQEYLKEEDMTKEALKTSLEEDGYKVK